MKLKTSPPHCVNGLAQAVRDRLRLEHFQLHTSEMSLEEIKLLLTLPQIDEGCVVKRAKTKSRSAFDSMREFGIIAGFLRGADKQIKILIVYTERPDGDCYEYGFVNPSQIVPK
jgi:hypothetical protein